MVELAIIWLLSINFAGFVMMGRDKKQAIKGRRRIPEARFFVLALIGGAFGILVGMKLHRHKTKHLSFKIGMPVLMLLHLIVIYALWAYSDLFY